ncbi:hypothetical protein [Facklamia sp. P12950]|uniref:hypothetical protein n=1 Tax=Facklamia sp. P12950 TaxID=3421951 RepID=UPI003D17B63A
MEKTSNEQVASSLMAISIVTKKLARQLMSTSKGEKDVKDKVNDGCKGRCRESCV